MSIQKMSIREIDARLRYEADEFARRRGPHDPATWRNWTASYHDTIAFEQARGERSQFEWFASVSVRQSVRNETVRETDH